GGDNVESNGTGTPILARLWKHFFLDDAVSRVPAELGSPHNDCLFPALFRFGFRNRQLRLRNLTLPWQDPEFPASFVQSAARERIQRHCATHIEGRASYPRSSRTDCCVIRHGVSCCPCSKARNI